MAGATKVVMPAQKTLLCRGVLQEDGQLGPLAEQPTLGDAVAGMGKTLRLSSSSKAGREVTEGRVVRVWEEADGI